MRWLSRKRNFALRVLVALLVALTAMLIPLPVWAPQRVVWVQIPVTVFLLVCYLGKLLYDTLFYERLPW